MCQIYLTYRDAYAILLSNIFDIFNLSIKKGSRMYNEKMKSLRQELGLSQAELAKRVGVSRQTINMIENGGYNPTIELCIKLCRELGVTLNDIFWRD